ncbi:MAG: LCP family protein [Anaerovoracaceae bacterium]|nr:LCP family protein [Anaerovoracaceae bacterium]
MRTDKTYYTESDIKKELGAGGTAGDGAAKEGTDAGAAYEKTRSRRRRNRSAGRGRSGRMNGAVSGRKHSRARTVLIVVVCLAVIAASVAGLGYGIVMNKFDSLDHDSTLDAADLCIDDQVAKDLKDYTNVAVFGVDNRDEEEIEKSRSDAIAVISINNKTKKVKMFTVMRDSYLQLDEDNDLKLDKVTHAHAYEGPVGLVRALNRNLDLNITNYVRVDWKTVADTVDAMGGLVLNVDEKNIDEMNKCIVDTNRHIKGKKHLITHAGRQTLDGIQTVAYCRIRKVDGDDARSERVAATIEAAQKKATKMSLSELNKTANTAMPEIKTSLSSATIMSMLLNINSYKFKNESKWPYEYNGNMINGVSYTVPDSLESNVSKLHEIMFGQKDYECSDTVKKISDLIKESPVDNSSGGSDNNGTQNNGGNNYQYNPGETNDNQWDQGGTDNSGGTTDQGSGTGETGGSGSGDNGTTDGNSPNGTGNQ